MKDQIAIGVLAYNVADYVEEVLSEIQEFKLEVYVIDDASTDDTAELLEKLKNKFDFKLKKIWKIVGQDIQQNY